MTRLLVISPHADDAELGCGGYISQITNHSYGMAHNLVVAVGDVFFGHLGRTVTAKERIDELANSMAILGCGFDVAFETKDRVLDTLPLADVIKVIEKYVDRFHPTEVMIPLPSSHQDHDVVYRACLAALRPSQNRSFIQRIAAYEYAATSWGAGASYDAGKGGLYVELTDQDLEAKVMALGEYKTQVRDDGHTWSISAARAMAKMRGLESGLPNAELFHVMREIRRAA